MNKQNILIEFVLTNQCNKRCKYCDLDFHGGVQSEQQSDVFVEFLQNNASNVNNYIINFFGGEPLLEFNTIKKTLSDTQNISNIGYSIGTNGILLDEQKYQYLKKYDVQIYLSIDTETYEHIFKKQFLLEDERMTINFILNPETISKSFYIFKRLVKFGFKLFNIIPVYITIDWTFENLKDLKRFVLMVKEYMDLDVNFYSYYAEPTSDIQFILDTDGYFYRDIHTHLWFLKQFQIVDQKIKNEIEEFSQLQKIKEDLDIHELIQAYQQNDIIRKSFLTPKYIGFEKTLRIIDGILIG